MKQKIKLITDSCSDIPRLSAEALRIQVLPFPLIIDGEGYHEGVEFTPEEFYGRMLAAKEVPTHSQIIPIVFEEIFEKAYQDGYTDVIYTSINANGSTTNSNAHLAVKQFFEAHPEAEGRIRFRIIDSGAYTVAYGMAVMEAARKIFRGASAEEAAAYIQDWVSSVRIYFVPLTLEYAKKSGRVSSAAGFVGELLGLKPVITFEDGDSKIVDKVRGEKSIIPRLIELAKQEMVPETPYSIVHGIDTPLTGELTAEMEKHFGKAEGIYPIGATVSINAGPRVVGIIFRSSGK